MNLFHLLTHLPHDQLRRLADEFGTPTLSPSKNNLITSLSSRYRDKRFMYELFTELPYPSQGLLSSLLLLMPNHGMKIQIPDEVRSTWHRENYKQDVLQPIVDRGFFFREYNNKDHQEWILIPDEIVKLLHSIFVNEFDTPQPIRTQSLENIHFTESIVDGVYHLLSVLLRHPARITQQGKAHRKTLERWRQRFSSFEPSEEMFLFIFSFCEKKELLHIRNDRFRPTESVNAWLDLSTESMQTELWQSFMYYRILRDPMWQRFLLLLWITDPESTTAEAIPVFSIDGFEKVWKESSLLRDPTRTAPIPSLEPFWDWLAFMGFVQLESVGDQRYACFTKQGYQLLFSKSFEKDEKAIEKQPAMVQPSFQILVPPTMDFQTLWKVEHLAEFQRRDVLSEFRLTQDSVLFALRAGWEHEEIFKVLNQITENQIPDNVLYSVEEWAKKYGQIQFRRTVLIECAAATLADELSHFPQLQEDYVERISDRYFVVDEGHAKQIFQLLQSKGYEPAVHKKSRDGKIKFS